MSDPYFFGYGSLVNNATHSYPDARPARLHGWRRAWVGTPARGVVLLTAVPSQGDSIQGLVAAVPGGDWLALDTREEGYARVWTKDVREHALPTPPQMAVYSVRAEDRVLPHQDVILLSYLDVVVQGFSRVFGQDGVQAFFDTTDGWDTTILDDRAAPLYPRHQSLTSAETGLVDSHLERLSAKVQQRQETAQQHRF